MTGQTLCEVLSGCGPVVCNTAKVGIDPIPIKYRVSTITDSDTSTITDTDTDTFFTYKSSLWMYVYMCLCLREWNNSWLCFTFPCQDWWSHSAKHHVSASHMTAQWLPKQRRRRSKVCARCEQCIDMFILWWKESINFFCKLVTCWGGAETIVSIPKCYYRSVIDTKFGSDVISIWIDPPTP